jgi:hypothetical protein
LKAQAAQDRWHAEKGLKDRVDIISLLEFADVKQDVLGQLLAEYDTRHVLREAIKKTISESRIEYKFLGLACEKDCVHLRRSYKARYSKERHARKILSWPMFCEAFFIVHLL